MAPTGEPDAGLASYLDKDLPEIFPKYDQLWTTEDPEETPYKSKYEGRRLLEEALKEVERRLAEAEDGQELVRGQEMLARLLLFLGKNYYYCEEVPTAERHFIRSLEKYLRSPHRLSPDHFVHIQDCFNQLGMLWCNRQGYGEGMNFLRRAQIMFENRPESVRQACEARAADNYTLTMFYLAQAYGALQKPALSARFCAETMSQQLEHNTSGRRSREARERDPFDCKDWVRNCCSLSDYFVNECMFWTAEYLLHSALIMCERCQEICGLKPDGIEELRAECTRDLGNYYSTRLKFAKTCAENPTTGEEVWRGERKPMPKKDAVSEGSRLSFTCAADAAALRDQAPESTPDAPPPMEWDAVFPEVVHLEDEEALDNRLAEETPAQAGLAAEAKQGDEPTGEERRAVGWLEYGPDERVRLPVYFRRLHELAERRIRRANAGFLPLRAVPPAAGSLAEAAVAAAAEAAAAAAEQGGPIVEAKPVHYPSCVGPSFEAARELFRLGNHYQLKALEYFLLDGWVTEHVRILQELSQMYRTLMFWERDPKRLAAMMVRRCRMLSPLLEVLNMKVYIAFWRQLSFEAAEVFQQLYELKAHGKFPETRASADDGDDDEAQDPAANVRAAARCNELAKKSLRYYSTFVDSYLNNEGRVPERIDDDNCRVYLMARLNRARLRTKMRGLNREERIEAHKAALQEYRWLLDYGQRNPEVHTKKSIGFQTELKLCEEMAAMLPSKLDRIAANRL